jgi:hypothetical protein
MQNCTAPQNREDAAAGRAINENPHVVFYPITDADRQTAQDNLRATIAQTIRDLNPLSEDE